QRKAHLPFFIGARFAQGIRRSGQLEAIGYMVLDLDDCHESPAAFAGLRARLQADERVWMAYTSPGGLGLKLVFRLARPLQHTKAYSDCYQCFARSFARRHDLERVMDYRTHDVTRVSFLSYDPQLYFAPEAEPVEPDLFLPGDIDLGLPWADESDGDVPPPREIEVQATRPEAEPPAETPATQPEPQGEVWDQIRRTLAPTKRVRRRQVTLPPEIEAISPAIQQAAEALGLGIKDTLDLNYGRKFVFSYQHLWAEVNVYYGKHGFSIVPSPKSGSHPPLRELVQELVFRVIFEPEGLEALQGRL
ncbi:MAG: hypothetical protein D6722_12265, partial [Bacteroidetes bacterium]